MIGGGVIGDARSVQLLHDGEVQTLLREQDLDVAAAKGGGNGGVENRLGEQTADEGKGLHVFLTGALAALHAAGNEDANIRPGRGAQDDAAPGGFFEPRLRFANRGIFLERARRAASSVMACAGPRERKRKTNVKSKGCSDGALSP